MKYLTESRTTLVFEMPLGEVVTDFFDEMKSRSKGYASMQYESIGYRPNNLVRLDTLIAGELAPPLALGATLSREIPLYSWRGYCDGTLYNDLRTRTSKMTATSPSAAAWRTCRRWSRRSTLRRAMRIPVLLFMIGFRTSGRRPVDGARLYPRSLRWRGTSRRPIPCR